MQNLEFNTGMIELAIQGDESRVLRFNPGDSNIQAGFFALVEKADAKSKEISHKTNEINCNGESGFEKSKRRNQLNLDTDAFFRAELDSIFGGGTSDLVFGRVCTMATIQNGGTVFESFITALMPFFTKEIKERNEKVQKIIQDHKPPKR
jgi:hypothetical protein